MRIISCNVNGIRSAIAKGFWDWASRQRADVICLQELKALPEQIPAELLRQRRYHSFYFPAARPGYSGVAILTRHRPERVITGWRCPETDDEGRYIQADFPGLSVASVYLPSGSHSELRQELKFRFLDRFLPFLVKLRKKTEKEGRELVLCGDFNIAHKEIDLKNWRSNQKNSGFLPEERAWMDRLFGSAGFVDAFRVVDQRPERYTWWSNRGRAYEKNVGWRIDYHVVSPGLAKRVRRADIYRGRKFSDHAPLTLDYDFEIRGS